MAKLDDFGRPIYETAEEYNKAHKGGVCPRPYDDPNGANHQDNTGNGTKNYKSVAQRHATVQGSKKSMKIVVAIIVFFIALNIGIIFSMVGNIIDEGEVNFEEEVHIYDEFLGDTNTPLPEWFEHFSYNGQYYSLPTNYWKISQMGFASEDYTEEDIISPGYEEILELYDIDGCIRVDIRIKNNTDHEIPLKECMVDYFCIENTTVYNEAKIFLDFTFGNNKVSFESSYEEVEAYLGTPYWHYGDYSKEYEVDLYQWMYYPEKAGILEEQEDIEFIEIQFVNDMIESVSIEKRAYEEKE